MFTENGWFKIAEQELAEARRRQNPLLSDEDGSTRDHIDSLRKATQDRKESPQ